MATNAAGGSFAVKPVASQAQTVRFVAGTRLKIPLSGSLLGDSSSYVTTQDASAFISE
jgi:hypothetical protein